MVATTESPPGQKPVHGSEFLFDQLVKKLREKPPEYQQRVLAHIREKTGHTTLPSFHNNGSSEAEKVEIYRECLTAILKPDLSLLKGTVPAGQANAAEKPAEKPKPEPEPEPTPAEKMFNGGGSKPTVKQGQTGSNDDKMAAITAAIAAVLQQQQTPAVDEAQVRQIVNGIVGERMKEIRSEAMTAVAEYINKIPPRDVLEIRKWDGTVKEIKEQYHKQIPFLCKMITARNAQGWPEFIWAHGAIGAGKTTMLRQLGMMIGVPHCPFPCGPTTTEGRLLGYNNLANGSFVAGWLYKPYKDGGLVGLDEADLADASVLGGANSIENDEFTFGNGETVKRHKDFYLIAFANTLGTGATGGFIRNKLDAATLNRFTHVRIEYDEDLERKVFGNAKWADYVIAVRRYVEKNCGASFYVTPRATRKGAAYLAAGITPEQVADTCIFGLCSKEIKETILKSVGPFKP